MLELKDIEVDCILGDLPEERLFPRWILVDVALAFDAAKAGESDALEDTIDYAYLVEDIRTVLKHAQCRLLERAAKLILELCLEDARVTAAKVCVRKKNSMPGLGEAGIIMEGKA
ncbi:MAG: dihydroneopterin aldolase [Kiritimatiellae bacterium]|nr:dihydroneopterin aldolase [Kiritimatiellia bacterium]